MLKYIYYFSIWLVALFLLVNCTTNQLDSMPTAPPPSNSIETSTSSQPINSLTNEEYAVYDTVIKSLYQTESIELIVINDHTATDLAPGETLEQAMQYVQDNMEQVIDPETLADYKNQNQKSIQLEESFSLDIPYILLTETQSNQILDATNNWDNFNQTYPNAQGIMTLSRVGFNAGRDQAVLYIGNRAGLGTGEGFYVFLTKEGEEWAINSSLLAWVS